MGTYHLAFNIEDQVIVFTSDVLGVATQSLRQCGLTLVIVHHELDSTLELIECPKSEFQDAGIGTDSVDERMQLLPLGCFHFVGYWDSTHNSEIINFSQLI